jgi:hypothetical protein
MVASTRAVGRRSTVERQAYDAGHSEGIDFAIGGHYKACPYPDGSMADVWTEGFSDGATLAKRNR